MLLKKYAAQDLLQLDEEYEPVLFTPLGYPNDDGRNTSRKSIEELVVYK